MFILELCCVLTCSVVSNSLQTHGLQPTRHLCPWGFSRQEYRSGLPCSPPGDLLTQGSNPCLSCLLHWQAGSLPFAPPGKDPDIHQIWIVNQAGKNDWPKETWKRCPIKVIQTAMGVRLNKTLSLSLCVLSMSLFECVSINTDCTLFPPNKYLTCFATFHLCENSFLQS